MKYFFENIRHAFTPTAKKLVEDSNVYRLFDIFSIDSTLTFISGVIGFVTSIFTYFACDNGWLGVLGYIITKFALSVYFLKIKGLKESMFHGVKLRAFFRKTKNENIYKYCNAREWFRLINFPTIVAICFYNPDMNPFYEPLYMVFFTGISAYLAKYLFGDIFKIRRILAQMRFAKSQQTMKNGVGTGTEYGALDLSGTHPASVFRSN